MKWLLLNNELERILKETVVTWFELPSQHLLGRTGETEKLKILAVIGKTWTGPLSDRSQKHNIWASFPVALLHGIHEWFLLQVTQLEDFFGSEDVFFAYGNERYSREDFDLDVEGKESDILMQWWAKCGPATFALQPWFDFRNTKWTCEIRKGIILSAFIQKYYSEIQCVIYNVVSKHFFILIGLLYPKGCAPLC